MRICVLTPVFPPYASGMGGAAARIAGEMGRRGNEVIVVTPKYAAMGRSFDSVPLRGTSLRMTAQVVVRQIKPRWTFGNAAWVGTLEGVIPEDTEVVHLHWPFIGVVRALVKWKRRHPQVPVVVTYHMDLVGPGLKGRVFDAYVRRALPKVAGVAERIVVTSFDYAWESQLAPYVILSKDRATRRVEESPRGAAKGGSLDFARDDIEEIPLGVDTARFAPGPKDPALMARYGLKSDDRVILTVAALDRAHAFKGIEVVFEAMVPPSPLRPARHCLPQGMAGGERVWGEGCLKDRNGLTSPLPSPSKEREKYKLLIVGDGDLRSHYERLARRLGIADRVIFAGRVSDQELPAHYRLADVYVLASTSRSEAFGLSALEAASSGVAVVASDLAGVRSVVGVDGHNPHPNPLPGSGTRQGEGGVCLPPGDVRALGKAIEGLLSNKELCRQFGETGRRRAVEKYSWERVGEEYERVFEDLELRT